ncbi:MAG: DoxX family membrane protein [Acidobacteriia bacterium]|nr:DoxX family membrane protein [Terriglobia bacterium]
MQNKLQTVQTISRFALGLMAFLAGLDKFLNLLTNWEQYVSPLVQRVLPFSATTFMHIVGVIEIIVGLAILTKATRLGAYVAAAWLVCIAVALVTTGQFFDVAVRDLELAVAAFVLAKLTEIRESSTAESASAAKELRTTMA